ncbi:hypothetical protein GCM10027515_00230 [Schumannella luteola]|uniref:Uncharacterized protein n=1 Tax=Schumannella luteola TaxID=472059 RepID=A0A852YG98_9MICO|nr:hypothetical protein [Schumannella luteola]NYG98837.1 hypothetical protein [Schumannella luteola]TPW90722.1 hypothetical protein FJ656_36655 [Schumannella luteola]
MTRDESAKRDGRARDLEHSGVDDDLPAELRDAEPFESDLDGDEDDEYDDVEIDGTLRRQRFGVADLIVAIVFAFLFLVSGYAALGNLVGLPRYLQANGYSDIPWATLIAAVAAPVVLFVASLSAGRGRPTFERALILIVALAANAALGFSLDWFTLAGVRLS